MKIIQKERENEKEKEIQQSRQRVGNGRNGDCRKTEATQSFAKNAGHEQNRKATANLHKPHNATARKANLPPSLDDDTFITDASNCSSFSAPRSNDGGTFPLDRTRSSKFMVFNCCSLFIVLFFVGSQQQERQPINRNVGEL
jgi:hypothetical protein